jgi:hypothetical protein
MASSSRPCFCRDLQDRQVDLPDRFSIPRGDLSNHLGVPVLPMGQAGEHARQRRPGPAGPTPKIPTLLALRSDQTARATPQAHLHPRPGRARQTGNGHDAAAEEGFLRSATVTRRGSRARRKGGPSSMTSPAPASVDSNRSTVIPHWARRSTWRRTSNSRPIAAGSMPRHPRMIPAALRPCTWRRQRAGGQPAASRQIDVRESTAAMLTQRPLFCTKMRLIYTAIVRIT